MQLRSGAGVAPRDPDCQHAALYITDSCTVAAAFLTVARLLELLLAELISASVWGIGITSHCCVLQSMPDACVNRQHVYVARWLPSTHHVLPACQEAKLSDQVCLVAMHMHADPLACRIQ